MLFNQVHVSAHSHWVTSSVLLLYPFIMKDKMLALVIQLRVLAANVSMEAVVCLNHHLGSPDVTLGETGLLECKHEIYTTFLL